MGKVICMIFLRTVVENPGAQLSSSYFFPNQKDNFFSFLMTTMINLLQQKLRRYEERSYSCSSRALLLSLEILQ